MFLFQHLKNNVPLFSAFLVSDEKSAIFLTVFMHVVCPFSSLLSRFSLYLCFQHVDYDVFISGFLCIDSAWGCLTLDLWIDFIYQFGKILDHYLVSIFVLFFSLLLRLLIYVKLFAFVL